jgi:hypothetical protein
MVAVEMGNVLQDIVNVMLVLAVSRAMKVFVLFCVISAVTTSTENVIVMLDGKERNVN